MFQKSIGPLVLVVATQALPLLAQAPTRLTLDRIISGAEFRVRGAGDLRWLADSTGYTALQGSREYRPGRDIVRHDPANPFARPEVLVPARLLVPPGAESPLSIRDYSWSADERRVLIFTDARRVWRHHTRGDFWVLDLASGKLRQLGAGMEPATLQFAKFSPDTTRVAYVQARDLYVEELASGKITRLTDSGSERIINGTFDWVYEEELGLRDGFRWSPGGTHIAYWQLDTEGVGTFHLIDNTSELYSRPIPIRYPKVGTTNSAGRVGVIPAGGGETRWIEMPGDPREHYIARMDWSGPGALVLQQLNRLQNTNRVLLAELGGGELREILVERDAAWVELDDELRWLADGERFVWLSERDGWRHAYLISRAAGEPALITPGDYDVLEIAGIDEVGGWLYFIASPENPCQRYLYRAPLAGGEPERITPANRRRGCHAYQLSPDCRWAFHTHSFFGEMPNTALVNIPDHHGPRSLASNRLPEDLVRGRAEFFRVDIGDGVELDGWCMKPPDFDPARRYPVLFHVYGEPAAQTVLDRWGGTNYLWHLMLTQRGYVVMSIDNRGTPAPRGRVWRKSIYRQIGVLAARDQAAAVRAIIRRWDWVDLTRIGVWGWSGGGSMSLNAIFRYPELYRVAMAIAFIADQRYYDTIYQERYMARPQDNPEGFRAGSPITHAHQLRGDLLLVYGTGDDNCHYQNMEALVNRLVECGKHFTMMSYPNRSHGIHEGSGTRRHLYGLLTRYLEEHLPPGPRR